MIPAPRASPGVGGVVAGAMIKGREERDGTRHRRNRAMMGSITEEIQGTQEPKKKKNVVCMEWWYHFCLKAEEGNIQTHFIDRWHYSL